VNSVFSWLVASPLLVVGCGPAGPRAYPVSGTVTFDGKPVEAGFIRFAPAGAPAEAEAAPIAGGRYRLDLPAGPHRVEVSAARTRPGGPRGAMGELVPEEYIPARYNRQTELTAEVVPAGDNVFDFDLRPARK
jgi:hypothetical protein